MITMEIKLAKQSSWLSAAGYNREEQMQIYAEQLEDILKNTAWYLDNLQFMVEYRCDFISYSGKNQKLYKSMDPKLMG